MAESSYDGIPFPARDGCELLFISNRDADAQFRMYAIQVAEQ